MVEGDTPNYPGIDTIVAAMVGVFNTEAPNCDRYSNHELRIHPITKEDIYERNHGVFGRSPRIVDECRLMCYHLITRHTKVWDPLDREYRYWKYKHVGAAIGGRTKRAIEYGTHSCCILLADGEELRRMLHLCVHALMADGFDLWSVPKSLSDNPCDPS